MSEKVPVIVVEFSDGSEWTLMARPMAEKRADYYACEVDGHEKGSKEWEQEVRHGLEDEDDLVDWVVNNMNWKDVRHYASRTKAPDVLDYDKAWSTAFVNLTEKE